MLVILSPNTLFALWWAWPLKGRVFVRWGVERVALYPGVGRSRTLDPRVQGSGDIAVLQNLTLSVAVVVHFFLNDFFFFWVFYEKVITAKREGVA